MRKLYGPLRRINRVVREAQHARARSQCLRLFFIPGLLTETILRLFSQLNLLSGGPEAYRIPSSLALPGPSPRRTAQGARPCAAAVARPCPPTCPYSPLGTSSPRSPWPGVVVRKELLLWLWELPMVCTLGCVGGVIDSVVVDRQLLVSLLCGRCL